MYNLRDTYPIKYVELLQYVDEEEIMAYYFGDFQYNKFYLCPFTPENTPSFVIKRKDDKVKWIRFGLFNDKMYGPLEFVKKMFNLSNGSAIGKIYSDLCNDGCKKTRTKIQQIKHDDIQDIPSVVYYANSFLPYEEQYWLNAGLDQKYLMKNNIFPCNEYWINGRLFHKSRQDDPMYVYFHNKERSSWTIYRPLAKNKKNKFRKKNVYGDIMGLKEVMDGPDDQDLLIITKSYKDLVLLRKLKFKAIAPHSERLIVNTEILSLLEKKFKKIVVLYDNDETGNRVSSEFCLQYGYQDLKFPKEIAKDSFEYVCNTGSIDFLKEFIYKSIY